MSRKSDGPSDSLVREGVASKFGLSGRSMEVAFSATNSGETGRPISAFRVKKVSSIGPPPSLPLTLLKLQRRGSLSLKQLFLPCGLSHRVPFS